MKNSSGLWVYQEHIYPSSHKETATIAASWAPKKKNIIDSTIKGIITLIIILSTTKVSQQGDSLHQQKTPSSWVIQVDSHEH